MPIVEAVAISASTLKPERKALCRLIEKAMSDAVLECSAEGIRDPMIIKTRMLEARAHLLGRPADLPAPVVVPTPKRRWYQWFRRGG